MVTIYRADCRYEQGSTLEALIRDSDPLLACNLVSFYVSLLCFISLTTEWTEIHYEELVSWINVAFC